MKFNNLKIGIIGLGYVGLPLAVEFGKKNNVIGSGKKIVSETEWITRRKYHVSMASAVEINSGTVLTEDMVTYKNPGTGVPYKLASTLIGRRAVKKILIDQMLSQDMFE